MPHSFFLPNLYTLIFLSEINERDVNEFNYQLCLFVRITAGTRRHSWGSNPCSHAVLLLTLTLTLWRFNPQTTPLVGHPKDIPYTKFEHFGIFRFWVMQRTNKQTDSKILPTPTDNMLITARNISHESLSLNYISTCAYVIVLQSWVDASAVVWFKSFE